jgi:enoyl-CoA hydratase/carnithine racemase
MSVLRSEREGAVLRLILCDETSRNSLSEKMLNALIDALDDETAVIILAAEGTAFCSGHNLKELTAHRKDSDGGEAYFTKIFDLCAHLMLRIATHPCPIIAEVNGLASAAGCQLVGSCDLAYASTQAKFCTPGVNIGLFCSTPMVALSRSVMHKHAMEMLLTGGIYNAEYAYRIGLINAVLSVEDFQTHVNKVAHEMSQSSRAAIRHGKLAFHKQRAMNLSESYDFCSAIMVENMLDDSAKEGIAAFIEKRKAKWPYL